MCSGKIKQAFRKTHFQKLPHFPGAQPNWPTDKLFDVSPQAATVAHQKCSEVQRGVLSL